MGNASLRWHHYSNAESVVPMSYQGQQKAGFKPHGLWISDEQGEDGWSRWCKANDYGLGANAFAVNFYRAPHLLHLGTELQMRTFHTVYSSDGYYIDWDRVAAQWQGILITPYQWSLRLSDLGWYYSWDCASGCIWDAAAIASLDRIQVNATA